MTTLHLGVTDLPYTAETDTSSQKVKKPRRGKANRPIKTRTPSSSSTTTGQVAQFLENKYHVMEIFYELNADQISKNLEESLAGVMENVLMGAPMPDDVFASATSKVEDSFKKFLSQKEMEKLGYRGVPTKAALMGVSHRFKKKRGAPRPSFIDTGLYQSSFRSWIEK